MLSGKFRGEVYGHLLSITGIIEDEVKGNDQLVEADRQRLVGVLVQIGQLRTTLEADQKEVNASVEAAEAEKTPLQILRDNTMSAFWDRALYGPANAAARAKIVSELTGEKVTKSDKRVQWNNFAKMLAEKLGVTYMHDRDRAIRIQKLVDGKAEVDAMLDLPDYTTDEELVRRAHEVRKAWKYLQNDMSDDYTANDHKFVERFDSRLDSIEIEDEAKAARKLAAIDQELNEQATDNELGIRG